MTVTNLMDSLAFNFYRRWNDSEEFVYLFWLGHLESSHYNGLLVHQTKNEHHHEVLFSFNRLIEVLSNRNSATN